MLSATSAAASYGYTYDPAGQLDTLTSNLAGLGQSVVVDQAHNYLGRRKQLKTTIGAAADLVNDYAYDNLSRLTQVTQAAQAGGATVAEKRVDFAYEADNQIDTISRYKALAGGAGNLVATSDHAYDALRRLTDINNSPAQSSDWHWDYDAENQVTEFETTTSSGTANIAYAYDANGQLIGAAGAQTRSYVWDLNGNRRNYQDVGGANNQLTETATDTYTYDAEGNRKSATDKSTQQHTIYEWDHRNRLTKATIKANSSPSALTLKVIDIAYDAGDRRVSKTVTLYDAQGAALTPTTEYYVWDQDTPSGSDNVLFDFVDSDGPGAGAATLKTRYLLGDVVDQVLAQETVTGGEVLWLLQDNLGSVRETVKNDGTVNSRVEYDPFGNMISITDPSNGGAATPLKTRFNFTGQEYDADLKLIWYSDGTGPGRWYDPATGTFISEDPLGFLAGDANLHRYVANGATYLVDPSGREIGHPASGDSISRTIWHNLMKGNWDEALQMAKDCASIDANKARMLETAVKRIQVLSKNRKAFQKLPYKDKLEQIKTLEKTLRKHLRVRDCHTAETWRIQYEIDFLKSLIK
jgi:RHS repeat-associated protein